jgi:O-antigen biosynthesis protein WbqP
MFDLVRVDEPAEAGIFGRDFYDTQAVNRHKPAREASSPRDLHPAVSTVPVRPTARKRAFDLAFAIPLSVAILPFLVLVWCVVKLTSPGPGLFWSVRVGQNGRRFSMPKFRTMHIGAPQVARESLPENTSHTTVVGVFLRKLSIDELPQLWSVLRGDMSLIGPRPLLPNDPTTAIRMRRFPHALSVRPGVSGLAQVFGRNSVRPAAKARYDAFYAARRRWDMDLWILARTVRAVVDIRRVL